MSYNFLRGRQMIVHDPRINNPFTTPPTLLRPPPAYNVWTVQLSDPVAHIVGWAARVAAGGTLDALHFMAHGNQRLIQLGAGYLNETSVPLFRSFRDSAGAARVRYIVIFGCLVGSDNRGGSPYGHQPYFGRQLAAASGASVVMARELQTYSFSPSGAFDFGDFEGPVDVYAPGNTDYEYQSYNPFRATPTLNLEALIFGRS